MNVYTCTCTCTSTFWLLIHKIPMLLIKTLILNSMLDMFQYSIPFQMYNATFCMFDITCISLPQFESWDQETAGYGRGLSAGATFYIHV